MAESIEVVRVRVGFASENREDEGNPISNWAARGLPTGFDLQRLSQAAGCVELLGRLLAPIHDPRHGTWQIAGLAQSRVPAAGVFGAYHTTPRLLMRVYVREPRQGMELEIERELDFPHRLQTLVRLLRSLVGPVEIVQPVRRIQIALPTRQPPLEPDSAKQGSVRKGSDRLYGFDMPEPELSNPHLPTPKSPAPAGRGHTEATRPGAPPLACNVWLEEQLARLGDRSAVDTLYRGWLIRYRALRGFFPHDPRRSFRAAVKSAQARLERKRTN